MAKIPTPDGSETGQIVTKGINSYGILAQSIGGGGGLFILDPNPGAAQADPSNTNCGPNRLYIQDLRLDKRNFYQKVQGGKINSRQSHAVEFI